MKDRLELFAEIAEERLRQDALWGREILRTHDPKTWLTILMEEVGEVARAVLDGKPEEYRAELIQVAAVVVSAMEGIEEKAADGIVIENVCRCCGRPLNPHLVWCVDCRENIHPDADLGDWVRTYFGQHAESCPFSQEMPG